MTVSVSPESDRALKIPISVTPGTETEEGDYTVTWPGVADTLWFESGDSAQSFAIQANADPDSDDETVSLGFGTPLPARVSAGTPSRATLTLAERPTGALVIVGTQDTTFAERREGVVAPYRALSADGQAVAPVSWSLGGADADTLTIDDAGRLRFEEPPDYENPADANRDTVYEVTVEADADGQPPADAALPVSVRVTNEDEPGTVSLSPSRPEVGAWVTATLREPDRGVRVPEWQWERADETDAWDDLSSRRAPSGEFFQGPSIRPVAADVGYRLRVTASYLDGESADEEDRKSAQSGETHPVVATAPPPPVRRLEILGAADTTFAEGATGLVAPYVARYTDGTAASGVSWTLSGADAGDTLAIDEDDGELRFTKEPDYEHPKDADGDTVWSVIVGARTAGPPAADTTLGVDVRITNEDDPGVVSLAPPTSPQVGHQLRAQLRDPDGGVTGAVWQWQTRQPGHGGRAHQRVASDTIYRPVSGDAGFFAACACGLRRRARVRQGGGQGVRRAGCTPAPDGLLRQLVV